MPIIIDLTHTFSQSMSVHPYDEPASITKTHNLDEHKYNDWKLSSGMHVGTHIDGPGHMTNSPILLSDVPVDRFVGRGYLIDARKKSIEQSLLKDMPHEDGLIVLMLTGMDNTFGSHDYFKNYPEIPESFAQELVHRKIKMIGIDSWSADPYPFSVHKIFFENNIFIIENLTNLEKLVGIKNFTIYALPLKTVTDSSLARVIAIVNEDK